MPRAGSVYGRGLGRVNRRVPLRPLSGRGVATRLSDHPFMRAPGRFRQTFKGRVSHGKRISAATHARLSW
jgi:hypothetical protein